MKYAMIKNGIVVNVISLEQRSAKDFPDAVPMNDYPVHIGDTFDSEYFYRDGERVFSLTEQYESAIAELESVKTDLADAGAALNILVGEE